jgi:hypothetical protein
VGDEGKTRRGGQTTGDATAAPTLPPSAQAAAPVVTDDETRRTAAAPLSEEDSQNRTTVPRVWALENGERVLGIPRHELEAALGEDEREELTLNAVRKAVDTWRGQVQNPDTAQED